MNNDFAIEVSIEKIQNVTIRNYFNEVYQTFVNGNYRSSIVMLYSVLICDLVYKLRDLRDIYNDSKAKKILDEIETLQASNPKSPEWESKLIEFINERMTLLEPSDIVAIESLQKSRHLSAHPVLTNSDLLYTPNKDTVQALMRNILEGVLTNPPFFSNKIFDTFLNDLADIKDKITDDSSLQKYLISRYLKRLKDTDFKKLFRSLWKVVFIADDAESKGNRDINYRALKILLEFNKPLCLELIIYESDYYCNITKEKSLTNIALLLALFPEIFKLLDSSLQLLLQGHISKDDNLKFVSWFLYSSLKEHFDIVKSQVLYNLQKNFVLYLKKISTQNSCLSDFVDCVIDYFIKSNSYDNTQSRYVNALVTIIDDLNLDQMKELLEKSNNNNQIYSRIGMPRRIERIVDDNFNSEIDKSIYPNIFKNKSRV